MEETDIRYAGFWVRFVASLLDTLILALPVGGAVYLLSGGEWFDFTAYRENIRYAMHGDALHALAHMPRTELKWELLFELTMMAVVILFWRRWRGATPGKRAVGIEVVDAGDFGEISNAQAVIRTIGYIVSTLPLMAGFFMAAFRKDKRALHDLMAGTAVIYDPKADGGKGRR